MLFLLLGLDLIPLHSPSCLQLKLFLDSSVLECCFFLAVCGVFFSVVVSPCCCFVWRIFLLLRIPLGFLQKYLAMASERKRKLSLFDVVDDGNATTRAKTNGFPALNPYTNKPYSTRYYEILERRRELPVWQQKQEFLDTLAKNQTMILVGETGSGKTTQVRPQHTFPTFA